MQITTEQRAETVAKHRRHETDTGSPEVQIALLSARIVELTEHFKIHKKDFAGRRGLLKLVSQRRSLLDYLRIQSQDRYASIIALLGIRK